MLDNLIHAKKTKYVILDEKFKSYIRPDSKNINFFVDVRSVLKNFYVPKTLETFNSLNVNEKWLISSEILNVASHYRHYVWSRLGKYSTFYFFYSSAPCDSLIQKYPGYRSKHYDKYVLDSNPNFHNINKIVKKNLQAAKIMGDYLPHVYMIDTQEVDPNTVPYHFIKKQEKDDMSVILTNDPVLHQCVSFAQGTVVLTMKGDDSYVIEAEDIIPKLVEGNKTQMQISLLPDYYSYILAMAGHGKYDVKGVSKYGPMRSIESLQSWVRDGYLGAVPYAYADNFVEDMEGVLTADQLAVIKRNFEILDIPYIHENISMKRQIQVFDDQIVNRVDAKELRYLNDRYYNQYPLMLEYLMEGESYE